MKPVEILLVEDNPADIRLTQEAIKDSKLYNNLNFAMDGIEALDYLHKRNQYADKPTPDLIILDLNLPKKNGREVLAEIKNHDTLKVIPVVILTTSREEKDILESYGLHANCYITKPLMFDQFIEVVRNIENFWLSIVKLPPRHD